jgi:hypothetical protein
MENFRELFTEGNVDKNTVKGLEMIKNHKGIVKNSAVLADNEMYFEAKSVKQALSIVRSNIQDYIGNSDNNVVGMGGGAIDQDDYIREVLGNDNAKAYIKVEFKTSDIPNEYITAAGAKRV